MVSGSPSIRQDLGSRGANPPLLQSFTFLWSIRYLSEMGRAVGVVGGGYNTKVTDRHTTGQTQETVLL